MLVFLGRLDSNHWIWITLTKNQVFYGIFYGIKMKKCPGLFVIGNSLEPGGTEYSTVWDEPLKNKWQTLPYFFDDDSYSAQSQTWSSLLIGVKPGGLNVNFVLTGREIKKKKSANNTDRLLNANSLLVVGSITCYLIFLHRDS